jgi:hypothetical protein
MIRERITQRWRCKFELLVVGDGIEQIALGIKRGWWSDKEICTKEQSTPSLSLCPHNITTQHCAIYRQNATLKSKFAKTYVFSDFHYQDLRKINKFLYMVHLYNHYVVLILQDYIVQNVVYILQDLIYIESMLVICPFDVTTLHRIVLML